MSMYTASVPVLSAHLTTLDHLLDKAQAFADARDFDVAQLLAVRLAPDQFDLCRQVQTACDTAKFVGARLSGKKAPTHEDGPCSIDELRARIQSCITFLNSIEESDFEGAASRDIVLRFFPPGKALKGHCYLNEFALPNFYFHLTTCYAILRSSGVELGKRDYIRMLHFHDA